MTISENEYIRYFKQIQLSEVGMEGQLKLKNAKVLCVGAGGLGSPLLLYLASAGIKNIGIIDDDNVAVDNLHRQILYHEKNVGLKKVECAKENLLKHHSELNVTTYNFKLTSENAEEIISHYDIVADCSDNFSCKFLLNDMCTRLNKTLVSASISQWQGQCITFSGEEGPCLRCLYPDVPDDNAFQTCESAGVMNVLPGILGMIQAAEIIKTILQQGELLIGRMLFVDVLTMQFREFEFSQNQDCEVCKQNRKFASHKNNKLLQRDISMNENLISPQELKELLNANADIQLVDVRTLDKHLAFNIGGQHIPTQELPERHHELDANKLVVTYCTSGGNSMRALQYLKSLGFSAVKSLDGGMNAWER